MTKKESKISLTSILNNITQDVWKSKDAATAKELISTYVAKSGINQTDKDIMLDTLKDKHTLIDVQQYFANALLKYEGLGVIN